MNNTNKSAIEPVVFKAGDVLFRENEQSFHFFIIQDGQIEVFKTTEDGKKIPLAVVAEGTSIGEFAMIDRLPRSATAQALTDVKVVKVSEEAYQKLLSDLPDWAVSVMKSLVQRIRQTNDIIRRSEIVDASLRREIATVEYDPEGTNHDALDKDDLPDLA